MVQTSEKFLKPNDLTNRTNQTERFQTEPNLVRFVKPKIPFSARYCSLDFIALPLVPFPDNYLKPNVRNLIV